MRIGKWNTSNFVQPLKTEPLHQVIYYSFSIQILRADMCVIFYPQLFVAGANDVAELWPESYSYLRLTGVIVQNVQTPPQISGVMVNDCVTATSQTGAYHCTSLSGSLTASQTDCADCVGLKFYLLLSAHALMLVLLWKK